MTTATTKKTVVICEDQAALLSIFKHLLSSKGFEVETAADGAEGLDLIRSFSPDLLMLDLGMPATDGFAVLEEMGRMAGKKPYVIVVTGYEDDERLERAKRLGAREVWRKPFNASELMSRIAVLLAQGQL